MIYYIINIKLMSFLFADHFAVTRRRVKCRFDSVRNDQLIIISFVDIHLCCRVH